MHAVVQGQKSDEAEIKCNMSKLRIHDWRIHREIECNICCMSLNCIKEISDHRKTEHQIFKKIRCKYYPNCIEYYLNKSNLVKLDIVQMEKDAKTSLVDSVKRIIQV